MDYEISSNKTVLKYLFFFCPVAGVSSDMREILHTLTNMLGFREGESHTLTPKSALIFNYTGTTKRLHYMSVENSRTKHLGRFMKLYPVGNV